MKKKYFIIVGIAALFLLLSLGLQHYLKTSEKSLNIADFQSVLSKKIETANARLNDFNDKFSSADEDISYYIYRHDTLVFWTENELGVPAVYNLLPKTNSVLELPHSVCIFQEKMLNDSVLVAVIKIKNTYALPNQYLRNNFAAGFGLPPQVEVVQGNASDAYAVKAANGRYLFTLAANEVAVSNVGFELAAVICWIVFFSFLFYLIHFSYVLWGDKQPRWWFFPLAAAVFYGVILLCFKLNAPSVIFGLDLFSPVHYASGNVFVSLGHLLVFSVFLLAEIVFFYLKQPNEVEPTNQPKFWKSILLQGVFLLIFSFLCYLFHDLIFNSTFEITLSYLEDINRLSLLSLLVVLSWFAGFMLLRNKVLFGLFPTFCFKQNVLANLVVSVFGLIVFLLINNDLAIPICFFLLCLTQDLLHSKRSDFRLGNISVFVFVFSLFIVFFSLKNNQQKMTEKYQALAENLAQGELSDRNLFAEILLEDLDKALPNDDRLCVILNTSGKTSVDVSAYLHENYFGGFWKNYDIKVFVFDIRKASETDVERIQFYKNMQYRAEKIKHTNFYFYTDEQSKIDYLGAFDFNEKPFFIEFSPKRFFSGYSYPEPLFRAEETNSLNASVSVASYENDSLRSRTGSYWFAANDEWIPKEKIAPFAFNYDNYTHFVYQTAARKTLVISQKQIGGWSVFFTYWVYLFTLSFLIIAAIYLLVRVFRKNNEPKRFSFLSRLHASFQVALVISFVVIFAVSVDYLINQYRAEQDTNLQNKTRYIRQNLREMFKQYADLREVNTIELNDYLHNLSNIYKTDIHVYDNRGRLVASSQPIIFSRGLLAGYMSPEPFFEQKRTYTQTEQIGKLKYLSAYTRIFNDKRELLGFVAVPSFLSSDEMQKEIFKLLALIINVYLVTILLASFVTWLIERQLAKPIKALEEKLKTISLTGHNEHLDYRHNDEIGQLVAQYNQMVDKLQKSAENLAQSERETAWKQMARQVTHEINNPLTPMKLCIQQLQRMQDVNDERFSEYFKSSSQMLIEQIENLSHIATAFSNFAKMPEAKREPVDICARLESVVNLFKNNREGIVINNLSCNENLFVLADKEQLTQVFNNLLKNAIQAIPTGRKGQININTTTSGNRICIEIRDNGTGISPEVQAKLFVPNFTTKSSGMGLGLAIVKSIVENNGGKIWFTTVENEGTSFFLEFAALNP